MRGGLCANAQLLLTVEEHGQGKQYARYQIRPVFEKWLLCALLLLALWAARTTLGLGWREGALAATPLLLVGLRMIYEGSAATGALLTALSEIES